MARPKVPIDGEEVRRLAEIGCKNDEIASWFHCSTDTIERRFAAELTKGRSNLHMSLRRWQLQAAKNGNVTMMIWLGKQYLGQRDVQAVAVSTEGEKGIQVNIFDSTKQGKPEEKKA
jgi:hypothetical protein